jgi:squalene synthase HpnC
MERVSLIHSRQVSRSSGHGDDGVVARGLSQSHPAEQSAGAPPEHLASGSALDSESILAKAGSENFPVASRLFPRALRPHLMNLYGFARLVDDLGDEAHGDRPALLDAVSAELDQLFAGRSPSHPLMRPLANTVAAFSLPREPFDRLIDANRQDQTVTRYSTFDDLLDYCHLSATPVGELVLRLVGACTPQTLALSDATCIGLQLAEFWQDLGEDARKGRIYVPLEDVDRFGCSVAGFAQGRVDERFRSLMTFEVERAQAFLERGRPLGGLLPGRVGHAVRLFTAGGLAALEDLRRRGYDTFEVSGRVSRRRLLAGGLRELIEGSARRSAVLLGGGAR